MKTQFTSADLKIIAMGTMAVDHMAVAWIYMYGHGADPIWSEVGMAMRLAGRMAFPLYAFLLVQGFLYTKNWISYLLRLLGFAVISEVPFNLVVSGKIFWPEIQNTLFLLVIGLLCLKGVSAHLETDAPFINSPGALFIALGGMVFAWLFRADYGALGVLFLLAVYQFRNRPTEQMMSGAAILVLMEGVIYGGAACAAFFLLKRYNGERGKKLGFFPYFFYPIHFLIIYGAGVVIHGLHF